MNDECLRAALPELFDPEFWRSAFHKEEPFYDTYMKHWSRSLVEELEGGLDFNSEAIYGVKDHAIAPILCRLLELGTKYPEGDFVQTFAFYLRMEENTEKISKAMSNITPNLLEIGDQKFRNTRPIT
jgi:hypothetical protein